MKTQRVESFGGDFWRCFSLWMFFTQAAAWEPFLSPAEYPIWSLVVMVYIAVNYLFLCLYFNICICLIANRNRKLAEAFVKTGKPLSELEHILIPGHEPLGPVTAELVHHMLKKKGLEDKLV